VITLKSKYSDSAWGESGRGVKDAKKEGLGGGEGGGGQEKIREERAELPPILSAA
jgi:hypothetical protein